MQPKTLLPIAVPVVLQSQALPLNGIADSFGSYSVRLQLQGVSDLLPMVRMPCQLRVRGGDFLQALLKCKAKSARLRFNKGSQGPRCKAARPMD